MDKLEKKILEIGSEPKKKNIWFYFNLEESTQDQGWKIHISTQLKDAVKIFEVVEKILRSEKCCFKVAKNYEQLKRLNSSREISPTANKFITIYSKNDNQAKKVIIMLEKALKSFQAPKILSDFQCGQHSPVHYRYGAYTKISKYDDEKKKIIHVFKDNMGEYIEDKRTNFPVIPTWKEDLFSDEEKQKYFRTLEAISQDNPINKYNIEVILKKANRGNVYRATTKADGKKVIIKQGRAFVTDDIDGSWSAIDELKNEATMLKKLASKLFTANYVEEFYTSGDYFVVQSYIDGINLFELSKDKKIAKETKLKIIDQLVDIINNIHQDGYKLVDLSPSNFLYSNTGNVTLVDLENVTICNDTIRRVKTFNMVNPDEDLSKSSVQQDYFSLCMIGFVLLTGQILAFSKGDKELQVSALEKVNQALEIGADSKKLTTIQTNWLKYLLTLSTNTTLSEKIYKLSEFNNDVDQNYLKLDIKKYDLNCESAHIVSYLLTKQMDKEGRIINSNEFGEYVSSLSFQHGMAGYLKYISYSEGSQDLRQIKHWVRSLGAIHKSGQHIYAYSLLFGEAGYLWAILDVYNRTNDEFYYHTSKKLVYNLMIKYKNVEKLDFALGKAGVLLSFMKYLSLFEDNTIKMFLKANVDEIAKYYIEQQKEDCSNIMQYGFAHGYSGIMYVLYIYSKLFGVKNYDKILKIFSKKIVSILKSTVNNSLEDFNTLDLSWCEGISGLILYLCLIDSNYYADIIKFSQWKVFEYHLNMGTSFCHGLSSLMQTTIYNDNRELQEKIKRIFITRSYRDEHHLLVFQSEDNRRDVFDFGIGTLGIYWTLLGNKFPFEIHLEG